MPRRFSWSFIPTSRDALYDALTQGKGDFVAAGVTITPERAKLVDFTIPTKEHVNEIVVTGPGAPAIASVGDLSGKQVAVREKSVQFESLQALNEKFKQQGKAPVVIKTVPLALEDEDILEMTNAGLLKIVIADDFRAEFWKQILPDITLHDTVTLREEGRPGVGSAEEQSQAHCGAEPVHQGQRSGHLFGNVLLKQVPAEREVREERDLARRSSSSTI